MSPVAAPSPGLFVRPSDEWPRLNREIPLTGVRIHAKVTGPAARVRVEQTYVNNEKHPVESVYVFPLEERAAVCSFAITVDGKRVVGQVKEREQAFDDYDDAMLEGHGAYLLDQERPNVFTASVGNLMPGKSATIEIDYVAEMDRTDEGVRLMIPTTVSPRYIPKGMRDVEGQEEGDRVNPPVDADGVPYGLTLTVDADLLSPIRGIESPSHKIRSEMDGNRVHVELAGDDRRLNKDFVLLLIPTEAARPYSCQVEGPEGERFVLASFRPEIECKRSPVEVVFVVDCSGSMNGSSTDEARRTLRLCLRSLTPGDRFNIVRFGSTFEALFKESKAYDDESLEQADALVSQMDADLGGTEILTPLEAILRNDPDKELPRRIVLLTDGQVGNENDVIALARKHRDTTRFYAFGIGRGASEHLVRGLARASNGAAEFVAPGEKIEDKVLRHFKRLALPAASGARLEWDGFEVEDVVPDHVPSFGPGDTVTVLARVTSGESGSVRIAGEIAGRPIDALAEIGAASAESDEASLLPVLWARRRIQELEEGDAWTARRGSGQQSRVARKRERERKQVAEELVRLGEQYCLVSSATSFVAVEERAEADKAKTRAELRQIPVALTDGWGGSDRGMLSQMIGSDRGMAQRRVSVLRLPFRTGDVQYDLMSKELGCEFPDSAEEPTLIQQNTFRSMTTERIKKIEELAIQKLKGEVKSGRWEEAMYRLLLDQNAEGSWDLTASVAVFCDRELADLEAAAAQCSEPWAKKVLATLLILDLTERRGAPDTWEAILDKALAWFQKTTDGTPPPEPHKTWKDWARQAIK